MSRVLALAPDSVRLVAAADRLAFLHCDAVQIAAPVSALQAYCAMTSDIPAWLASAFRVRDFVSRWFNVADIQGFSPRSPEQVPAVGERLDFFTVEAISESQLVLASRDTHLAVMVCLDLERLGDGVQRLSVTTSVQRFNTFGRLYMLPVGPAHGPIVKRMLRNAVAVFPV
ncbi:DUF2867 domain-containing protein [Pseudomonas sp. LB-090624]|uniref:DUF2867 domain-containing protein n=1 Tax=Pseudomonas sp. LB-090624 TaxID=2213079 RepID=UPI000D821888|nr:DUF2867 domain-containing protein [Pseudomonas sp. LB-090624]PYB72024.1 DUF2867 domain-containing protein [Pseudomonas sp. LB-090624]